MAGCALWKLPLELRELIYSHAFSCDDQHACFWNNGLLLTLVDSRVYRPYAYTPYYSSATSSRCGTRALSLLRTCKAIHREALPVFHETLEIRIHVDGRYRSPIEIKGLDMGSVLNLSFLRNARIWDVTVRLSTSEDVNRLLEQLEALGGVVEGNKFRIEWRSLSVQVSRHNEAPEHGRRVLEALQSMTGIEQLDEIQDPWREMTTVWDYQSPKKP